MYNTINLYHHYTLRDVIIAKDNYTMYLYKIHTYIYTFHIYYSLDVYLLVQCIITCSQDITNLFVGVFFQFVHFIFPYCYTFYSYII